jgi:hypothetical protein
MGAEGKQINNNRHTEKYLQNLKAIVPTHRYICQRYLERCGNHAENGYNP